MKELLKEIKIPDLGGVDQAEIVEVLIKVGDRVEQEQTLAIMESDKATMDLPSNIAGIVEKVIVKVGDKISKNSLVALLKPEANKSSDIKYDIKKIETTSNPVKLETTENSVTSVPITNDNKFSSNKTHATPSVRLFARELGVDLTKIQQGSGHKNRILHEDVQRFVKKVITEGSVHVTKIPQVDFSQFGEIMVKPLGKIKRLTGEHLTHICLNIPSVTQHDEADITEMEEFRRANNAEKPKIKLTGLVFIIKALVATLKLYPQFNSSLSADGQSLIYKNYFNIGVAVDTPNGLVVPVIRDVEQMNLNELSMALVDLSSKAREGKLLPATMQGGTMTISSLGGIGGTAFTPIINAPEVAILGISRSKLQPVWIENEFIPRLILPLDLTYDHRVIDGAEAARFLVVMARYLSDTRRLLL